MGENASSFSFSIVTHNYAYTGYFYVFQFWPSFGNLSAKIICSMKFYDIDIKQRERAFWEKYLTV